MSAKVLTRRGFVCLAAGSGAAAFLAACQPKVVEKEVVKEVTKVVQQTVVVEKQVAAPKGKPIIRFTTDWYGGVRGECVNKFLSEWKDKVHPDITIAYEPCPRVQDRVRVDFAAGTPSDVMFFEPELFTAFGEQVLDVQDYYDAAPKDWKDDWLGREPCYYFANGRLRAVPFQVGIWSPSINVDLFKKAGVPMPWEYKHGDDKWWDWNDFAESAGAIRKLGADIYGYDLGGYAYHQFSAWTRSNGGEWFRPPWPKAGEKVVSALTEPATVDAITFLTGMHCTSKVAIPLDMAASLKTTLQVSPFYAGKIGINESSSESAIIASKLNLHRVVFPRSPKTKQAHHSLSLAPHVAYGKTQFPEACWTFMVFLDSPWAQTVVAKSGGMPGLKSVIADPDFFKAFPPIAKEALLTSAKEGLAWPWPIPNFEEWRKDVEPLMQQILLCKTTVADGLKAADATANNILSKRA